MLDSQPENHPALPANDLPAQPQAQPAHPVMPVQSASPTLPYYVSQPYGSEQVHHEAYGTSYYQQPTDAMNPMSPVQHAQDSYDQPGMRPITQPVQAVPSVQSVPPAWQGPATGYKRPSRGLRAGAILLLALVLAAVFGTGLFAGAVFFGRAGTNSSTNGLQSGTSSQTTVPTLSGNNAQAVREAVVSKVSPSVVQINVTTSQGAAIGSGVIIDQRGYIVTNNHVVSGASSIQVVMYDGTHATATLTGTDAADDLAVIKITPPAHMVVAPLGDSSQLKVGQDELAIGNPLGITQTVTNGIVSALNRRVSEGQGAATIPDAIQTDAPINPGNSGGALVDMQGNLIGIPTLTAIDPEFKTPASGVGFAIPVNRVKFIAPQIIQSGSVQHTGRAVLNVGVADVDSAAQAQYNLAVNHGVLIVNVVSGGAAARAGLKTNDVIVKIDNTTINDTSGLGNALLSKNPGQTITVTYYRGTQQQTVNVTLDELQAGS